MSGVGITGLNLTTGAFCSGMANLSMVIFGAGISIGGTLTEIVLLGAEGVDCLSSFRAKRSSNTCRCVISLLGSSLDLVGLVLAVACVVAGVSSAMVSGT